MNARTRSLLLVVAGLAAAAALPLAAKAMRGASGERCALNGVLLDPHYAVRVADSGGGASRRFCCVGCAAAWLAREPRTSRTVSVVDEESGREIDARTAWFVRSRVVAVAATESRIHTFATEAAARRHAEDFSGTVLSGDDLPLRTATQER